MFKFFKNKKITGIIKTLIFLFIFLFIFDLNYNNNEFNLSVLKAEANQAAEPPGVLSSEFWKNYFFPSIFPAAQEIGGKIFGVASDTLSTPLEFLVKKVFLSLAGWVLWLAGGLIDLSLDFTIEKMGSNLNKIGNAIDESWMIFRDIANILMIFVLLYAGIKTVVSGIGDPIKKIVPSVIIIAVLINFSMLFTKVFIDITNVLSVTIYESIVANNESQSIAGAFLSPLKLQLGWHIGGQTEIQGSFTGLADGILMFIFIIFISIVLFIIAIMLIARYVILIVLIITSSIAFGSCILPQLKTSIWSKWLNALIGQGFFAPLIILFLGISIKILEGMHYLSDGARWDTLGSGSTQAGSGILNLVLLYALTVGFLVASIINAKKLSDMAGGYSGKITGFMSNATLGGAAILGRNTLGRAGSRVANSSVVSRMANSRYGAFRGIGKGLIKVGDKMASGSMDLRGVKKFGVASLLSNVNVGDAGGTGGFDAGVKKKTEAVQKANARYAQLNTAEKERVAENNRSLNTIETLHQEIQQDQVVEEQNRIMEAQDRDLQGYRTLIASLRDDGSAAALALIPVVAAQIQTAERAREAARTVRNTRRDDLVAAANLTTTTVATGPGGVIIPVGTPMTNFGQTETQVANLRRQNAQEQAAVQTRVNRQLEAFENSVIAAITTGLNRNRISQSIRNQGGGNRN